MNIAYADPPYLGQAVKHYGKEAKAAGRTAREVNHEVLIGYLCEHFDAWALSLSVPSLQRILALCPPDVRVGAWVKPFCAFKKNVNPAYTWEPVIFWHGRRRTVEQLTTKDHLIESITMRKGFAGAKPVRFCYWLFELLGMSAEDEFTDVFPGSGIVSSSWQSWQSWQQRYEAPMLELAHHDLIA